MATQQLATDFKNVQAHYDLSDEFFALFLDPSMTYSCAYFREPGFTLAEAQLAKIDLSLGKLELRPGMTLLDIGCGWGATARRAADHYGAKVTGLTLSQNQLARNKALSANTGNPGFILEGWETFDQPVDRIVSIGAFEHFGQKKYAAFFAKARALLPTNGVMLLHTITQGIPSHDWDFLRFALFLRREIFPGGEIPAPEDILKHARANGFEPVHVESLRPHYAQTLDIWSANLEARKAEALVIVGQETYDTYMHYLTGCANLFRRGEVNLHQFKLRAVELPRGSEA